MFMISRLRYSKKMKTLRKNNQHHLKNKNMMMLCLILMPMIGLRKRKKSNSQLLQSKKVPPLQMKKVRLN